MTQRRRLTGTRPGPALTSALSPALVLGLALLTGCVGAPTGVGGRVVDKQATGERCLLYVEDTDASGRAFHVETQVACETYVETDIGDVLTEALTDGGTDGGAVIDAACAYRDTTRTWRTVSRHDCADVAELRRLIDP